MKVKLHARARADLKAIHDYLRLHASPASADRVRAHLRQRIMRLANVPRIGTASSNSETRILSPTRYPYRIYFTVRPDAVIILHIRHTSRPLPDLDDLR